VLTHWRSLLLRLYAQTIGESNSKNRNILDNVLVGIRFTLILLGHLREFCESRPIENKAEGRQDSWISRLVHLARF
jgi:hypothetical protein